MNKLFALLTFSLFSIVGVAQNLGVAIPVADGSDFGKTRPRLVVEQDGVPVVMWGNITTNKVYTAQLDGNVFTAPVQVTPGNVEAFVENWAGPDIASNEDDVFVTFHSQPEADGFVYVVKSSDGGLTFGDTVRAENIGNDQSRFPVMAVGPDGAPTVMFMRFSGNWVDPQYVVANSPDQGISYLDDVSASALAPGEVCDCCPGALLSEGQRQVAMFRNNDNDLRDLWVTVSTDNGAGFPTGDDVDPNNWMINSCPSSGADGYIDGDSLYTVWMSAGQGYSRVYLASVHLPTAAAGNVQEAAPVQNSNANQNYPRIAGQGDVMGVVYQEAGSGNIDCYITISTDGGISFSAPTRLHDDPSGTQRNPDITYSNGQFHVVFEDVSAGSIIYRSVEIPMVGVTEFQESLFSLLVQDHSIQVMFSSDGPAQLSLYSALGQEISRQDVIAGTAEFRVNQAGVYIVRMEQGGRVSSRRLIVE